LGEPAASDTPAKKEMRALLLGIVAGAEDADAIAQARALTTRWLADQTSVENTLAQEALFIAAAHGDTALFDQLQKLSTSAADPQLRENALYALAMFRDPVLAKRALDFAVSGQVRNQDAFALFAVQLRNRQTRESAWQYIQQNWDKVAAQLTTSSGSGLVGSTASFCSADKLADVQSFFATHKVAASEHALTRASNQIRDCIDLREAQQGNLKAWLAKQ
jgi:aminopeptidase N/puromycin-sensitive aminopeptidase